MASIPLPALGIQPVQGTDPLSAAAKVLTMKSLLQNQQYQQQAQPLELQAKQQQNQAMAEQLQEQTGAKQLYQQIYAKQLAAQNGQADPNSPPANAGAPTMPGAPGAQPQGSSPQAGPQPGTAPQGGQSQFEIPSDAEIMAKVGPVLGPKMVESLVTMSKNRADLLKAQADTQTAVDKHQQELRDALGNFGIQVQKHGYDPTWANQAFDSLASLSPSFEQMLSPIKAQITQGGPPALKQLADNWAQLSPKAQSDAADLAAKNAALPGQQAESAQKQLSTQAEQQYLAANPGKTAADYEASTAGQKAAAEAKARFPYESSLVAVRQQVENQLFNQQDAVRHVETNVLVPYQQKLQSVGELQSAVDQASAGNIAAARAIVEKFVGVSNPDGTKRLSPVAAQQALQMGSVPQRFQGTLQNIMTGDNWTPEMSKDIKSFADAQAQVALTSANSSIDNLNTLHGTKIGHLALPATPKTNAAQSNGAPPSGATGKARGGDGKLHWTNQTGVDLGPAE